MPRPSGGDAMGIIKRIFETVAVVLVSAALCGVDSIVEILFF